MRLIDFERPALVDLFSGAGGAAEGYRRAGFKTIVGIDIVPQPNYPFTFILGDALKPPVRLEDFDLIHASPPCQAYSRMRHLPWLRHKEYPDLIPPTKAMLKNVSVPWIIENVEGAPLERGSTLFGGHGTWLCGRMFDLPLYRHRVFQSTFSIKRPDHPHHDQVILGGRYLNKRYSQSGGTAGVIPIVTVAGYTTGMMQFAPQAMGIDWMTRDELTQAIPPAYTEFLGRQFLDQLARA